MPANTLNNWPVEQLQGRTTTAVFRNPADGKWNPQRASLHEEIIGRRLAGKQPKDTPMLRIVMGGVGSGKSTLIRSKLEPKNPDAVVIDADQLWLEIPEYVALAAADWRTAGERTYGEVRYLRDALLAEAAAWRVEIILEVSGDSGSQELVDTLERDGYEVKVNFVDCSPEEARERIGRRANSNPTPEDNLWCSPRNPEYPDKYDYQNVEVETFQREYQLRRTRGYVRVVWKNEIGLR